MNREPRLNVELQIESAKKQIKKLDNLLSKINEEIINGYFPCLEMEEQIKSICRIGENIKSEIELLQKLNDNSYSID